MTEDKRIQEPPWLSAAVDQRLAYMIPHLQGVDVGAIITTPLTEPGPGSTEADRERWERACDNCGAYTPEGPTSPFYTGHVERRLSTGHRAAVFFGMCQTCKDLTT